MRFSGTNLIMDAVTEKLGRQEPQSSSVSAFEPINGKKRGKYDSMRME